VEATEAQTSQGILISCSSYLPARQELVSDPCCIATIETRTVRKFMPARAANPSIVSSVKPLQHSREGACKSEGQQTRHRAHVAKREETDRAVVIVTRDRHT